MLAVLLAGWGHPTAAAEMTRFKVGISEPVNTVLALWMAEAGGFYAAQGLAVEITSMNGGSRGAAELQAGRIDAMHVGLSSVVKLNEEGGDLRTIASLSNVIRFTFFTAPGVKTAADLKGGVVGVSAFGSESDFHRYAGARPPRHAPERRHSQGIWRRHAAPRRTQNRRDQGHRDQ